MVDSGGGRTAGNDSSGASDSSVHSESSSSANAGRRTNKLARRQLPYDGNSTTLGLGLDYSGGGGDHRPSTAFHPGGSGSGGLVAFGISGGASATDIASAAASAAASAVAARLPATTPTPAPAPAPDQSALISALEGRINDLQDRIRELTAAADRHRDDAATQRADAAAALANVEARAVSAEARTVEAEGRTADLRTRLEAVANIARRERADLLKAREREVAKTEEAAKLRQLLARELERARDERSGITTASLQRDAVMASAFVVMAGHNPPQKGIDIPNVPHVTTRSAPQAPVVAAPPSSVVLGQGVSPHDVITPQHGAAVAQGVGVTDGLSVVQRGSTAPVAGADSVDAEIDRLMAQA